MHITVQIGAKDKVNGYQQKPRLRVHHLSLR